MEEDIEVDDIDVNKFGTYLLSINENELYNKYNLYKEYYLNEEINLEIDRNELISNYLKENNIKIDENININNEIKIKSLNVLHELIGIGLGILAAGALAGILGKGGFQWLEDNTPYEENSESFTSKAKESIKSKVDSLKFLIKSKFNHDPNDLAYYEELGRKQDRKRQLRNQNKYMNNLRRSGPEGYSQFNYLMNIKKLRLEGEEVKKILSDSRWRVSDMPERLKRKVIDFDKKLNNMTNGLRNYSNQKQKESDIKIGNQFRARYLEQNGKVLDRNFLNNQDKNFKNSSRIVFKDKQNISPQSQQSQIVSSSSINLTNPIKRQNKLQGSNKKKK